MHIYVECEMMCCMSEDIPGEECDASRIRGYSVLKECFVLFFMWTVEFL